MNGVLVAKVGQDNLLKNDIHCNIQDSKYVLWRSEAEHATF